MQGRRTGARWWRLVLVLVRVVGSVEVEVVVMRMTMTPTSWFPLEFRLSQTD